MSVEKQGCFHHHDLHPRIEPAGYFRQKSGGLIRKRQSNFQGELKGALHPHNVAIFICKIEQYPLIMGNAICFAGGRWFLHDVLLSKFVAFTIYVFLWIMICGVYRGAVLRRSTHRSRCIGCRDAWDAKNTIFTLMYFSSSPFSSGGRCGSKRHSSAQNRRCLVQARFAATHWFQKYF